MIYDISWYSCDTLGRCSCLLRSTSQDTPCGIHSCSRYARPPSHLLWTLRCRLDMSYYWCLLLSTTPPQFQSTSLGILRSVASAFVYLFWFGLSYELSDIISSYSGCNETQDSREDLKSDQEIQTHQIDRNTVILRSRLLLRLHCGIWCDAPRQGLIVNITYCRLRVRLKAHYKGREPSLKFWRCLSIWKHRWVR